MRQTISDSGSPLFPSVRLAFVTAALLASTALWGCNREEIPEIPPYTDPAVADADANEPTRGLPGNAVSQEKSMAAFDRIDESKNTIGPENINPDEAQGSPRFQQAAAACPMLIDNVSVEFEELPGTAALNFRTTKGDVLELQRRVEQMARMYEMHDSGRGSVLWQHHGHMRGETDQQGQQGDEPQPELVGVIPPSTGKVDNFATGARLVLRPTEPDDLETLREQMRKHQEHLAAGECWMTARGLADLDTPVVEPEQLEPEQ